MFILQISIYFVNSVLLYPQYLRVFPPLDFIWSVADHRFVFFWYAESSDVLVFFCYMAEGC